MTDYVWILAPVLGVITAAALLLSRKSVPPDDANSPVEPDGTARVLKGTRYMQYRVGRDIAASPEVVWELMTNPSTLVSWNSTVTALTGEIRLGGRLALQSVDAPGRTFKILVSSFERPSRMVWEDGGRIFRGVRTFTMTPHDGGTRFTMVEVYTGAMLDRIAPHLPDFTQSFETFARDLEQAAIAHAAE